MIVKKGSELQFISRISRDGKSVQIMTTVHHSLKNETYKLTRLSLTEDTWIASGFNSYVVRYVAPKTF